jgi:hypothetical protein
MPSSGGASTSGTNLFGTDYFYQYMRNELFPLYGGGWSGGSYAGVWGRSLSNYRTYSSYYAGFRCACYPE